MNDVVPPYRGLAQTLRHLQARGSPRMQYLMVMASSDFENTPTTTKALGCGNIHAFHLCVQHTRQYTSCSWVRPSTPTAENSHRGVLSQHLSPCTIHSCSYARNKSSCSLAAPTHLTVLYHMDASILAPSNKNRCAWQQSPVLAHCNDALEKGANNAVKRNALAATQAAVAHQHNQP